MRLRPGDIFFTKGSGVVSYLIRFFTNSPTAHVGVVVGVDGMGRIDSHEAFYPSGVRSYKSKDPKAMGIERLYRLSDEPGTVSAMLARSDQFVGLGYDLFEIFRIINHGLNRMVKSFPTMFLVLLLSLFGSLWFVYSWLVAFVATTVLKKVLHNDNADRVICSNHTAEVAKVGRPDLVLTYPTTMIWPGRLEQDLHLNDWSI